MSRISRGAPVNIAAVIGAAVIMVFSYLLPAALSAGEDVSPGAGSGSGGNLTGATKEIRGWGRNSMAAMYLQSGDTEKAKEYFKIALEENPDDETACIALADIYQNEGDSAETERYWKRVLEINPSNEEIYYSLGALYRSQRRWNESYACYTKALELNPQNTRTQRMLESLSSMIKR